MRICTKCQKAKPITEYHKDPKGKNGHCARCKDCKKNKPKKAVPTIKNVFKPQLQTIEDTLKARGARLEYHEHLKTFYFYTADQKTKEVKSLQELLV